ncbi:MAG TPA: Ig-like domain-containing protein [Solirubrobacteraceae bacterium]|nr:Ig-like domain-containing protein [Solirubrobacteraceae bacterium]
MRAPVLVAAALLLAFMPASAALGHGTAADHMAEDSVHDVAAEPHLVKHTRTVTASDARAAAAAVTGDEHIVGQWGPVVDWPVVGVHVALMPNGKVLAYDSVGDNATETYPVHDHTRATLWDPATGTQTPVWVDTGYNVFCSGLAHLTDGRLFVAGGNLDSALNGIRQTHIFDPSTNTWSVGPDMASGRWYPTVTPLNNGEMLITSGRVNVPEVRTTSGSLRSLSTASLSQPLYPWTDVAPDGRAFVSGPDTTLRSLNTGGTGTWQSQGTRDSINRDYGGHALYDIGKILVAGGGGSTRDARIIDINGATPSVTQTQSMAFGRRQNNLTVLADGSVLATGGNSSGAGLVDLNNGVYNAERWNPATGTWTTLAAESVTRQYHSTAMLLPDGRILSSGGGICGTCDSVGYLAKNAQVFTPPYLFKTDGSGQLADRPVIDAAPAVANYGQPFQVDTAQAGSISKVALLRLGSVTHSVNMEQRYIPLGFTAGAASLTATAPANANIAPPGVYMLFVVDNAGVPSVAKMVTVTAAIGNTAPSVSLTAPADGASYTTPATVSITASASDVGGSVAKVEFFDGTTKLGEDATAPYAYSWANPSIGSHSITARATDDLGAQTTSTARTITVTNGAPSVSLTAPANGASFLAPATISIAANASDAEGIASVEFFNGTSSLGLDTTAPYAFDWTNVPAGSYSITARATDTLGAQTTSAPRTVTVSATNAAPTVSITSPANGSTFRWNDQITINASASDPDGTVARVEFYRNDGTTLLATDTSAPYSFRWKDPPAGTHLLRAKAYDNRGAVTTSAAVTITVRAR